MSILTGQACPDKRGKPTTYASQIMIIDAPPAALTGKSAGKRKNISEKARSSIFNKVDKTDWPWLPRLSMLLIRDLQVNHWDCMCTRQEARNWWRLACLNKGFACVIVSLQREHGGAERLRAKKILNCSNGTATQHCTVSFEVRAASTVVEALPRDTLGITAHTGQPVSTVPGLMAPINTVAKRPETLYWEGWAWLRKLRQIKYKIFLHISEQYRTGNIKQMFILRIYDRRIWMTSPVPSASHATSVLRQAVLVNRCL